MNAPVAFLMLATLAAGAIGSEPRATTDYEIAAAETSLREARTSVRRIAAHLNLGDLRALRTEMDLASTEYRTAERIAGQAAREARLRSDLEGYSRATAYRGIALAKLGDRSGAFASFEEAIRYQSDSPRIWNHYAWAMGLLNLPAKAEAAARNAVALAKEQADRSSTTENLLDLAIYRFALAGALLGDDPVSDEALRVLDETRDLLASPQFERIRERVADTEAFEIFSFVGDDSSAWLSLYNRVHLRLGALLEARGEIEKARDAYRGALALRSDDPQALAALARLASAESDRDRWFADSFAANPFSPSTILAFETYAGSGPEPDADGTGGRMQRALWLLARDRLPEAQSVIERLARDHPANAAVLYLAARQMLARGNVDDALATIDGAPTAMRQAIAGKARLLRAATAERTRLAATLREQMVDPSSALLRDVAAALASPDAGGGIRSALDLTVFSSLATMDAPESRGDGVTIFQSGSIGEWGFRFTVPTAFRGLHEEGPARIAYRITGVVDGDLLIEPLGLEQP